MSSLAVCEDLGAFNDFVVEDRVDDDASLKNEDVTPALVLCESSVVLNRSEVVDETVDDGVLEAFEDKDSLTVLCGDSEVPSDLVVECVDDDDFIVKDLEDVVGVDTEAVSELDEEIET